MIPILILLFFGGALLITLFVKTNKDVKKSMRHLDHLDHLDTFAQSMTTEIMNGFPDIICHYSPALNWDSISRAMDEAATAMTLRNTGAYPTIVWPPTETFSIRLSIQRLQSEFPIIPYPLMETTVPRSRNKMDWNKVGF